jgi:peptidoglycan/LPS O-acetylase OafA/YrhL
MVSAFSLFRTMPNRLREAYPTVSFYTHRFFRIAPMFYAIVAASYVRDVYLSGVFHGPIVILESLTFVFSLMPGHGIVWAGWTITVEMLFYLVFPLIYRLVRSISGAVIFLILTFTIFFTANILVQSLSLSDAAMYHFKYLSIFRHAPAFACGSLLFMLTKNAPEFGQNTRRFLGILFVGLALGAFYSMSSPFFYSILPDGYTWHLIVYSALFLGLWLNPIWPLVNRATTFLGRLSFSVYLIHPILIYFLVPVYRSIYAFVPSIGLAYFLSAGLTLIILIPLSYVTCLLIEEPGIAAGKRVYAAWVSFKGRPAEEQII